MSFQRGGANAAFLVAKGCVALQTIYQPKLTAILPTSITNDPKLKALAEALDVELERLSLATREVLHLPRLDELSGNILDFLAEQFHIDFWEPLYLTDDEKKNLIRTSIAWHRIKGTCSAVKQIAAAVFREVEIVEWFDYVGGLPYRFIIKSHGFKSSPDGFATFLRMLNVAKNARSWLDKIIIEYDAAELYLYSGAVKVESGLRVINPARPTDRRIELYSGIAQIATGLRRVEAARPTDKHITLNLGNVTVESGVVYVLPAVEDLIPRRHFAENAIADIAIADIAIARTNKVPEYPEPPEPDIYAIPDGEWLRVYMDFATGRDKPILLKNPRADLTVGDINSVGVMAVLKQIFNNQHAENTLGIRRADLIRGFTLGDNDDAALIPDSGSLRLFFDFPQGNARKILLHNPRSGITIGDIKQIGRDTAVQKLLLNARAQTTFGIKHASIVKHFAVDASNEPVKF